MMEDTIKLPLDADGVPIRPGDVIYMNYGEGSKKLLKQFEVRSIEHTDTKYHPWVVNVVGDVCAYTPEAFTHTNPDTLEDIEKAINELMEEATLEYLAKAEIKEKVAPLMERIKRMVER